MKTKIGGGRAKRLRGTPLRGRASRIIKTLGPKAREHGLHLPFGIGRKPAKVYGAIGPLEVRLARSRAEVRRAQRLRYEVFYDEMSAKPSLSAQLRRRDQDAYDSICDHLLVIDKSADQPASIGAVRAPAWSVRIAFCARTCREVHGGFIHNQNTTLPNLSISVLLSIRLWS